MIKSEPNSQEFGMHLTSSQCSDSSGSPSLSPAVQTEAASRTLKSIGLSPLVTSGIKTKGGKVTAAKRKIDAATSLVRKKVCRALGIHAYELENTEARKAKDHDLLMNEVKQRIPAASKIQRYQLLSLVPLSMSINEASQFFGVSRTLFTKTRQLKIEKGIMPVPNFERTSSVPESTKLLVVDYYCSDENSKVLPGARDCVSVGKGVYEQKRLILMNLPELHKSFKKDNEGLKIGISLFSSLRPKWCVFAGGPGTHEQCICQIHQNFKLILYALNIKMHYRDLIKLCVCDSEDRSCMLRLCEKCPTLNKVQEIIRKQITMPELPESEQFSSDDEYEYFEEMVKFRQWKSTDRTEMVAQLSPRAELLEIAARQISDLIPHDYISRSQRDYLKKLKEELPRNKVIVAMDFSMNYNCLIQGAVQSYHWSPKQATVHPTAIYYKDDDNVLGHKSIIFISDDVEHDVPMVKKFQEKTVAYLKENFPHVNEMEYVTDGCGSQYKSKGYFKNLCHHEEDFGIKASHTYFATSHGKSQCDADGGSVKRKARKASLQRPLDNQIINAEDLFKFCQEELSEKFQFQFVPKSEVALVRNTYAESMKNLETVPGTRSFHFVKPQPGKIFGIRLIQTS